MNGINNDQAQKPHQDVQNRENDEFFNSIGPKDYHLI